MKKSNILFVAAVIFLYACFIRFSAKNPKDVMTFSGRNYNEKINITLSDLAQNAFEEYFFYD